MEDRTEAAREVLRGFDMGPEWEAVFDPDMPYVLDKRDLRSLSKNSPFDEARLQGQVTMTMVAGRVVFQRDTM